MKQAADNRTLDAFQDEKRRGRPPGPTGKGKTNAQHAADYRARKAALRLGQEAELRALRVEAGELRREVVRLRDDNAVLARELERLSSPKARVVAAAAAPLAAFFDEVGISHDLGG